MTIPVSGFIWVINVIVGRDNSIPIASLRQPACKMANGRTLRGTGYELERKANCAPC